MSKSVFDFFLLSVFFAFLTIIVLLGRSHFQHHSQKWKSLIWGCVVLSLISALQFTSNFKPLWPMTNTGGIWSHLSTALIFGYLLGGLLVLGGLGSWLFSLFKSDKMALSRLKQLTCFKSLLSVANHSRDLEEILRESLGNFMLIMGYRKGVIFRSPYRSGEAKLVAHWGFPPEKIHRLHNLSTTNPFYSEARESKEVVVIDQVRKLPEYNHLFSAEDRVKSLVCVPLKYKERICGVMGIYDSRKEDFIYQETQFLSIWGNMLGIVIEELVGSRRNKLRRTYLSAAENICELMKSGSRLEDMLPVLSGAIQKIIDFQYLSLALLDRSGENMRRLTIGMTGTLLLDKGMSLPARGTPVEYVVQNKEALLDDDVCGDDRFIEDDLQKAMGIRSRLIVPLKDGKRVCAVLTLGHIKHGHYTLRDVKWLDLLTALLTIHIQREQSNFQLEKTRKYSTCLDEIAQRITKDEHPDIILNYVASTLTKELPSTFCRIALLDYQKKELQTKAWFKIRNQTATPNIEAGHLLADLPWHRLVLEAKKLMLVNQDDPESTMSQAECRGIMTEGMRSALLVPLVADGESLGVMSLGEERNWQRRPFSKEDMDFVNRVALQLSVAVKYFSSVQSSQAAKRKVNQTEEPMRRLSGIENLEGLISDLSYGLNDPLTSIIGSAELLRLKTGSLDPEIAKYTKMIEKNANKMHEAMRNFVYLANRPVTAWIDERGRQKSGLFLGDQRKQTV